MAGKTIPVKKKTAEVDDTPAVLRKGGAGKALGKLMGKATGKSRGSRSGGKVGAKDSVPPLAETQPVGRKKTPRSSDAQSAAARGKVAAKAPNRPASRPAISRSADRGQERTAVAERSPVRRPGSAGAGKPRAARAVSLAQKFFRRRNMPAFLESMSLDRKLDILGIVLAVLGLLTALSLASASNNPVTGGWLSFLSALFGWGVYLFAVGLIAFGGWLVLRNFERVPQLSVARITGVALLFVNLLAIMHFLATVGGEASLMEVAQNGRGGGLVGGGILAMLNAALGVGGAVIVLLAWLVIALNLFFDLTLAELVRRISPLISRFQDWWIEAAEEHRARQTSAYEPLPAGTSNRPPGLPTAAAGRTTPLTQPQATPVIPATPSPYTHGEAPQTWVLPPVDRVLDEGRETSYDDDIDRERARLIEETLNSFGAPARVVEINRGPTITQFGVEPDFVESRGGRMRVRVGKITSLADDLALALSARTIRIQAPVPGKGFVGIEVPNDQVALVALRDILESEALKRMKSPLRFALGLNVSGNAVAADLAAMPHLLIAGATGSGKSVCVNALICCLLINNTPDDLRLIMVDPKRVELTGYNGIPHLLAPVVVDLEKVVTVLQWVMREMDMRYRKLAEAGCRNVQEYNSRQAARGEKKLPYLVVIVDELADLMMLSPEETERSITRLAQLARATGIHLVIATQRPSVDVVTGLIKANFPARVAFAVASGVDSRVILDQPGAERLLGRGDMLFQAPDSPAPARLQGVFVSDGEIQRLVAYWQSFAGRVQAAPTAAGGIVDAMSSSVPLKQMALWEEMEEEQGDPLMKEAIDLVRRQGRGSISMLQTRFRIGYTRAARLIDTMEEKGIVGPPNPTTGTREVLDYGPAAPPVDDV